VDCTSSATEYRYIISLHAIIALSDTHLVRIELQLMSSMEFQSGSIHQNLIAVSNTIQWQFKSTHKQVYSDKLLSVINLEF
jgi:hypothetical protein